MDKKHLVLDHHQNFKHVYIILEIYSIYVYGFVNSRFDGADKFVFTFMNE